MLSRESRLRRQEIRDLLDDLKKASKLSLARLDETFAQIRQHVVALCDEKQEHSNGMRPPFWLLVFSQRTNDFYLYSSQSDTWRPVVLNFVPIHQVTRMSETDNAELLMLTVQGLFLEGNVYTQEPPANNAWDVFKIDSVRRVGIVAFAGGNFLASVVQEGTTSTKFQRLPRNALWAYFVVDEFGRIYGIRENDDYIYELFCLETEHQVLLPEFKKMWRPVAFRGRLYFAQTDEHGKGSIQSLSLTEEEDQPTALATARPFDTTTCRLERVGSLLIVLDHESMQCCDLAVANPQWELMSPPFFGPRFVVAEVSRQFVERHDLL